MPDFGERVGPVFRKFNQVRRFPLQEAADKAAING
jgi:hypothetical protein